MPGPVLDPSSDDWSPPEDDQSPSRYVVTFRGLDPSRGAVRVRLALAALFPGAPWSMERGEETDVAECFVDASGPPDLASVAAAVQATGDRLVVERVSAARLELRERSSARPGKFGQARGLRRRLALD